MAENVFIVRLPFSWSFFLASDYLFSLHTLGKSTTVTKKEKEKEKKQAQKILTV